MILGSFASAAIWRIPQEGISLLRPKRSFCPLCETQLAWFENIPILSWLFSLGRCRHCKESYGFQYLGCELSLAVLIGLTSLTWAAQAHSPFPLLFMVVTITALFIAAAIDWQHFILPDGITLGGIPFGILVAWLAPSFQVWDLPQHTPWGAALLGFSEKDALLTLSIASSCVSALLSFVFLFGIRQVFSYLLRQEALGLGDVKLLTATGALLGLEATLWAFLIAVFLGSVLGLMRISALICFLAFRHQRRGGAYSVAKAISRGYRIGRVIPFGPPLVMGILIFLMAPAQVHSFFTEDWPGLLSQLLS
ncbi:MAG: prepilin peptidase [Planctomycetes bacterium]|nr:prepilin peptidase [Planctomycetota bacterium]